MAAVAVLLLIADRSSAAQTYVVRKGDTLWLIAKEFSTTVAVLEKANKIDSKKPIRPGMIFSIPSAPLKPGAHARVTQDKVEVKSDGEVIAILSKDARVVIVGKDGDALRVKLADGRTGGIPANSVAVERSDSPLPGVDRRSFGRELVRTAYAYRGARYRRGGTSSRGFDCSGFVKFVYARKGIRLPHSSRELYKCGKRVAKSELQPGDLVFFANTYRRGISHVGIYIGNGKFIHASTRRTGVRVDHLGVDYYRRRYAGARRIQPSPRVSVSQRAHQ